MKSRVKIKRNPERIPNLLKQFNQQANGASKIKVGLPSNSANYPDGTSVIMVGLVHEFGEPDLGIPERSFLRTGIRERRRSYVSFILKLYKKVLSGEMTNQRALNLLGLKAQSDVRQKITDLSEPPLEYREGNPLVDTGHLRRQLTYVIEGEGDD